MLLKEKFKIVVNWRGISSFLHLCFLVGLMTMGVNVFLSGVVAFQSIEWENADFYFKTK